MNMLPKLYLGGPYHRFRLHIEYGVLYVADLRTIMRTLESAYNILQRAERRGRRIRRDDRLRVQTLRTGNSLTLILLGGAGLAAFERMLAARERFWKSEESKWKARSARLDYEEKAEQVESLHDSDRTSTGKAEKLVENLISFVDKSKEITSVDVELDGHDRGPDDPGALLGP